MGVTVVVLEAHPEPSHPGIAGLEVMDSAACLFSPCPFEKEVACLRCHFPVIPSQPHFLPVGSQLPTVALEEPGSRFSCLSLAHTHTHVTAICVR